MEMEMVEGGDVGGEDICCGGVGLAASPPVSSTANVDVPRMRLTCPLLRCCLTPLLLPAEVAEEVGNEAAKYTTVSNINLSPLSAANIVFGYGTHLPPPPAAGQSSPINRHRMLKPLLPPPHRQPPPATISALVVMSTAHSMRKDIAALPSSQQSPPYSAHVHGSGCCRRHMP
jgi:hypothetical protein